MSGAKAVEPNYGTGKKSIHSYLIGIVLSTILTLIPFMAVMYDTWSHAVLFVLLFSCAVAQFLVHVLCFLRLNVASQQGKYNVLSFVFSIVVLLVVVIGSLWIMWHLNYNMMN